MNKLLLTSCLSTIVLLSSCSTTKELSATGGSKADGTVKLSYEYSSFEKPVLNKEKALLTAVRRCKAWGYQNAEAFGGQTKSCQRSSAYGCNHWFVTVEYQCLNQG